MCPLDRLRFVAALLVLLFASTALAAPAVAQERSDREYDELIEKLELGISALDELGRHDAQERLMKIADEVRQERATARARKQRERPRRESDEIREVRRRLAVMRHAVEVLVEVGRHDSAEQVERAMHARELAIAGRRDEEAQKIRASAPDRAQLTELLRYASKLQAERGRVEKAQALSDLAAIYFQQWKRRQRAEEDAPTDLADRSARLEVLRLARNAHAEKGNERLARLMTSAVEIGELQLAGADGERVAAALASAGPDFTIGLVIESLQAASGLYREWRQPKRAASLNALAEYYARRERDRRSGRGTEVTSEERADGDMRRLAQRLEKLEAELADVRAQLKAVGERRAR